MINIIMENRGYLYNRKKPQGLHAAPVAEKIGRHPKGNGDVQ
jgi:hypothetical protein